MYLTFLCQGPEFSSIPLFSEVRELNTLSVLPLDHADYKVIKSLEINGRAFVRWIGQRHHLEYQGPIIWRESVDGEMKLMQLEVVPCNISQTYSKGDGKSHD